MRQAFLFAVFMLAMAVWTMAQQSGASGTASSSQTPSASQSQSSASGDASQGSTQTPGSAQTPDSTQTPGSAQSGAGTHSQSSQTPSAGGQGQSSSLPGSAGQGSAQTPGQTPGSAQTPGAAQPPDSAQTPGAAQGQAGNTTVTEGCLGGSNPNFTITDKAGTTYKLNIPAGADVSPLNSHVGESVQVMGQVNNSGAGKTSSIDATRIGRGTGNCQAGTSKQTPR